MTLGVLDWVEEGPWGPCLSANMAFMGLWGLLELIGAWYMLYITRKAVLSRAMRGQSAVFGILCRGFLNAQQACCMKT